MRARSSERVSELASRFKVGVAELIECNHGVAGAVDGWLRASDKLRAGTTARTCPTRHRTRRACTAGSDCDGRYQSALRGRFFWNSP